MGEPRVLMLLGSRSDQAVAKEAASMLKELDIPCSVHVASAHRSPQRLAQLVKDSPAKVLIAMAGAAASLPGVVASMTMRPVIGVPVSGTVPHDSLLSIVQAPSGTPVATVGVDRGDNAALLAASILALSDESVQRALAGHREAQREQVIEEDAQLQAELDAS